MAIREIRNTEDGSRTLHLPEWNENYHSTHGALQEAKHVFLNNGLECIEKKEIRILEFGLGTGLNALLTAKRAIQKQSTIHYLGLEKYPINFEELKALNHQEIIQDPEDYLGKMHRSPWEQWVPINEHFWLMKNQVDFREFQVEDPIDLVYFDAFGFRVQAHLWSEDVFQNIYNIMNKGGLLTTYSSKGLVRRTLDKIGFETEKRPGPKGKREMLVAWKR